MPETVIQLTATQLAKLFGIVPMTFKRSATLEHIPHQQISLFKLDNDHTLNLVLTHASTRNRVLKNITILNPLQYFVMTLLHGIAIVRVGKPSWKVDKVCTPVGGTSTFYHTTSILVTKHATPLAVSSAFNSFSCIDYACVCMPWQIDQVIIVPSNC